MVASWTLQEAAPSSRMRGQRSLRLGLEDPGPRRRPTAAVESALEFMLARVGGRGFGCRVACELRFVLCTCNMNMNMNIA